MKNTHIPVKATSSPSVTNNLVFLPLAEAGLVAVELSCPIKRRKFYVVYVDTSKTFIQEFVLSFMYVSYCISCTVTITSSNSIYPISWEVVLILHWVGLQNNTFFSAESSCNLNINLELSTTSFYGDVEAVGIPHHTQVHFVICSKYWIFFWIFFSFKLLVLS